MIRPLLNILSLINPIFRPQGLFDTGIILFCDAPQALFESYSGSI